MNQDVFSRNVAGVSADQNPFRMQVLESIPYQAVGESNASMWDRIETMGWRGAVVGPHGSGKTTLLDAARKRLESQGVRVLEQRINRQASMAVKRKSMTSLEAGLTASAGWPTAVLFDGYGHLSWPGRRRLRQLAFRQGAGLLVAAHRPTRLPTWVRTRTDEQRLAWLVDRVALQAGVRIEVDAAQRQRAYQNARGNLRLALRSLFDEAMEGRVVVRSVASVSR